MKTAVIGAGAWGTTLANHLAKKGEATSLWVREAELAEEMRTKRENTWFLPGMKLSEDLFISSEMSEVLRNAECHLMVVPAQFCRRVLSDIREMLPKRPVMVCASKGIELTTLSPMSRVFEEALEGKKPRYAHLSGPTFAKELAEEMPTSIALGCEDKKLAESIQKLFFAPHLRVYTNPDFRGVELGGALKNIIAIAAGISDGLGFGLNARAALLTRGIAEMSRLGCAMGAKAETFMGLSGLGDLILTCTGDLSRNRQVGLRVGKGEKIIDILASMKMVAEGVKTTEAVHKLARKLEVDMPITEEVYALLYQDKEPSLAATGLMGRSLKGE